MANLYDKSSLVMIPSGKKDGTVFSQKPVDGSGDFTFSRGSNLAATRVGPTGLIEKGRENLLLRSNDFDTTWNNDLGSGSSIQDGQTGYDGSNDAWLITKTKSVGRISQESLSFGGVSTFSVYAKKADSDYIVIQAASNFAYFDLTTGLAQNETSGIISASSTDEGNGWYRCSIVFNVSASSTCYVYPAEDGSVSATSGSIYIQSAQLEIGLAATDYIESGATTGKAGLLEDEPRFDYSGGATCPSLLLEPSRTNLIKQSEYFDSWSKTGLSVSSNAVISPDGNLNGTEVNITAGGHFLFDIISASPSTTYTFSWYAKRGTASNVRYSVLDNTNIVDIIPSTSYYNDISSTEWKRVSIQFTTPSNCSSVRPYILRDGGQLGTVYLYGAQLEEASYPTSYIPNHSGGSVTRGAETSLASNISSLFGSNNTFYSEFVYYTSSTSTFLEVNQDGGAANLLQISATSSDKINYTIFANGAFIASRSTNSILTDGVMKVALKYDGVNYKVFLNGSLVDTYSQTSIPVSLNRVYCGNARGSQQFGKGINQTLLFPEALSDADCITLTTL